MSSVLRSIFPNVKLSRKQYQGQRSSKQWPGSWISTLHFCRLRSFVIIGGSLWVSPQTTEGTEQELEGPLGGKWSSGPLESMPLNSEPLGHSDLGQRDVANFKSPTK